MGWKVIQSHFYGFGQLKRTEPVEDAAKVHVFRGWRHAVCSAAAREYVLMTFGDVAALEHFFGGYMTFGRIFRSDEFLGVWGHRNADRFRRLLRERLGEIEIVHAPPPAPHSGNGIARLRPTPADRRELERQLKARWVPQGAS